jgi:alpha-galactosidase
MPLSACGCGAGAQTNETDVRRAADGLVSSGMRAAGYRALSLDGGWWGGGKSGKVRRNASGYITVNDTKFPSSGVGGNGPGLLPLSRYITARGFLFGHYTSADAVMCSKDVGGSGGNEEKDAALFASWNISLMKLDDCKHCRYLLLPTHCRCCSQDALT